MSKELFIDQDLAKQIIENKKNNIVTYTRVRKQMIIPEFVGANVAVYNGKKYINIFILEDMVRHKLGEFSPTRTYKGHTTATKKLKLKK